MNKENTITSCLTFILFYLIISYSLQSCVSARDRSIKKWEKREWKVVKADKKEKPSWVIFKRKISGTDFLEYKIEGAVMSAPDAFVSWFKQDIHNLANGSEKKKYPTYKIVDESEDSLLTYVIHNEPFPLKNTEMSVRYIFSRNEDGSVGVKWHEAWEESQVQPVKKLKRIESFRGSWKLSPTADSSNKALTSVKFDPKGMPSWLFEPMVFKFLRKGLEDLRAIHPNWK